MGNLSGYDDLQRMCLRGVLECIVGVEGLVQSEPMRDQSGRIDLLRSHGFQKHRGHNGIDPPGRDRNVLRPQQLQMQVHLTPCTPMLAMMPAGPTSSWQSRKVASTPTASIAVSTLRPPVRMLTVLDAVPYAMLIIWVAPNCRASPRRLSPRSIMMVSAGE